MRKRLFPIIDIVRKKGGAIIAGIVVIAVLATGFIFAINTNKPINEPYIVDDTQTPNTPPQINTETKIDTFENPTDAPPVNLSATNKLVLYRTERNKEWFDPAVNIYKEMYPDVEVDIKDFEFNMGAYMTLITTEIMTGKGPDLFFTEAYDTLLDLYKAMDADVFYDLNNLIENDPDFNLDDYNNVVLDSGIYKGKRYLMPLSYMTRILLTSEETLAAAGMDIDKLRTFDGLHGEINKYIEKYASTKQIYDSRSHYFGFFPWSGVEFIDYENKKATVDGEDFKKVMEAYKDYYKQDLSSAWYKFEISDALRQNNIIFGADTTPWNIMDAYGSLSANDCTPVYFPFPGVNGKITAQVYDMAFILNASPNKKNAYNFLKVLLSEKVQSYDWWTGRSNYGQLPVLHKAMDMQIENMIFLYAKNSLRYFGRADAISEETIRDIGNMMTNVDDCQLLPLAILSASYENYMTSYLSGSESYDKFLGKLRNFLELYVSE